MQNKPVKFFFPDYTPEQLRALGVMDHKGIKPLYASQKSWPKHWVKKDKTGWGSWFSEYSKGRRHPDDEWQKNRWHSFKARHGAEFLRQPTPKRAFSLINWAIDPIKFLKKNGVDHTELEAAMKNHRQKIDAILDKTAEDATKKRAHPKIHTSRGTWDSDRFVTNRFRRDNVIKNPFRTKTRHLPSGHTKRASFLKIAIEKRLLGSAFGTVLGSIPGLVTYDKKDKSKSIGRILLGAGAGMTAGSIGGMMMDKGKFPDMNSIQSSITKRPVQNILATLFGAGLGAVPGLLDIRKTLDMPDDGTRRDAMNKAFGKLFIGGSIGGGIMAGNSVLKILNKKRK